MAYPTPTPSDLIDDSLDISPTPQLPIPPHVQLQIDSLRHELHRVRRENENVQAIQQRLRAVEANYRVAQDAVHGLRRENENLAVEVQRWKSQVDDLLRERAEMEVNQKALYEKVERLESALLGVPVAGISDDDDEY